MRRDRVIFVDDDFFSNIENCEFLRGAGFNVSGVYRARAAYELIDKHYQLSALVTDIDLGPGADGFDVADRAQVAYPRLPVVFISGSKTARARAESFEHAEFIAKPFHPRQVVEALDRVIHLDSASPDETSHEKRGHIPGVGSV